MNIKKWWVSADEGKKLLKMVEILEELTNTRSKHRRWILIDDYKKLTGRNVGKEIDL